LLKKYKGKRTNKVWRVGWERRFLNDGLTGPHITEVTYFKREQLSTTVLLGGTGWGDAGGTKWVVAE